MPAANSGYVSRGLLRVSIVGAAALAAQIAIAFTAAQPARAYETIANLPFDGREAKLMGGPTPHRATVRSHVSIWAVHNNDNFSNFAHGIQAAAEIGIPEQTWGFFLMWGVTFQADVGTVGNPDGTGIGDFYLGGEWQFANSQDGAMATARLTLGLPTGDASLHGLFYLSDVADFLVDLSLAGIVMFHPRFGLDGGAGLTFNAGADADWVFHGRAELAILLEPLGIHAGIVFTTDVTIDLTLQIIWVEGVFGQFVVPLSGSRFDLIVAVGYIYEFQ